MKLFIIIYLIGSFISIFLTLFIIEDIGKNLDVLSEKSEKFISEKFNIHDSKKYIRPNIIFISNFFWSWIFVILFSWGFIKGAFNKKNEI